MSRLILTNNRDYYNELKMLNYKYGFRESGIKESAFWFINYKKLKVDNYNFFSIGDDFVASTGSFMYKGMIGAAAFHSIFEDYDCINMRALREKIVGTYALVIKKKGKIVVFIDETGNHALYYYKYNNRYLITNLVYHIGIVTGADIDETALLEELNEYCILDNKTYFIDTYRLMGDELIEIDLESNALIISKIETNNYKLLGTSFEEVVDTISDSIIKYAKLQSVWSNTKVLFMTGGMDSRLALAGDIAAGYNPKLANWQGSPVYMNTKIEDSNLCKQIAETLELEFELIDVNGDKPHEINISDLERIGEYACIYGNNGKWHDYFDNAGDILFDFGYFGETVKEWIPLELRYHDNYTIYDYAELYLNRQKHLYTNIDCEDIEIYKKYIINKLKRVCIQFGMNINRLSKEDCMFLYYVYRTHADTKMVNFANIYGYSFNMYAQKELIDYINQTPYEYKKRGKLNLALTKKLCSQLMELPYFSHCHYINYNAERMTLEDPQLKSFSSKLKRMVPDNLKKIIKKSIGKETNSMRQIKQVIDLFSLDKIRVNWLPQIDENTYCSVGEYKSYYDHYIMLRNCRRDEPN